VGMFPELSYDEATITLQPGDLLVAFTDGVTEAQSPAGEEFTAVEAAVVPPRGFAGRRDRRANLHRAEGVHQRRRAVRRSAARCHEGAVIRHRRSRSSFTARVCFASSARLQGQEGPLVIYSMTTSSPEDAPRGKEFLYSLNRTSTWRRLAHAARSFWWR